MARRIDVLFATVGGPDWASSRLRVFNLLSHLSTEEFRCEVVWPDQVTLPGPELVQKSYFAVRLLIMAARCDVLYLQKLPLPEPFAHLLDWLVPSIVFDLDDAIYTAPFWEEVDEGQLERAITALELADSVVAGSPAIGEYVSRHNPNTEILLPSLPSEKYRAKRAEKTRTSDNVTIGWIGNPENLRYLATVEDELAEVLDSYDEARVLIITAGELPVKPLAGRTDVEYREWSVETELDDLAEADVSIRPLTDDEWTRSKGGFVSVLQPMALGIPVVVTPVGLLADIVEHGRSGFHAEESSEWTEYLGHLIENQGLRTEMGEEATRAVDEQRFWAHQRAEDLAGLLRRVANHRE